MSARSYSLAAAATTTLRLLACAAILSVPIVGCSRERNASALPPSAQSAQNGTKVAPSERHVKPVSYTDWSQFGYDLNRSNYNPNETTIGTGNVGNLHLIWKYDLGDKIDATPVLATAVSTSGGTRNLLYIGAENGIFDAIDADTGDVVWSRHLGAYSNPNCNDLTGSPFGITGSAAFDRTTHRVYVVDGQENVYALDMSNGTTVNGWPVSLGAIVGQNHPYSGVAFNAHNGMLYASTASYCDNSPWQGRVAVINTATATLTNTFFPASTAYGGTGSGGGVWGPVVAAIDYNPVTNSGTSDVFVATGNGDGGTSESAAYNEHLVRLKADLSTVVAANYPQLQGNDVDFGSSPVIFTTPGCSPMVVVKNKSGILAQWQRDAISSGPVARVIMAPVQSNGDFIGSAAFSPTTNFVYVSDWANGPNGKYVQGMNALAMNGNCVLQFQWGTSVNTGSSTGNEPTSTPTIGNGVVYFGAGLGNAVYAFDAQTGAQLWSSGGTITGPAFSAPMIDGHLYVGTWDRKLYAFGL